MTTTIIPTELSLQRRLEKYLMLRTTPNEMENALKKVYGINLRKYDLPKEAFDFYTNVENIDLIIKALEIGAVYIRNKTCNIVL